MSERSALAHLYRRVGFGARPDELDAAVKAGYAATVAALLDRSRPDPGVQSTPPPTLPLDARPGKAADAAGRRAYQQAEAAAKEALVLWWLDRMVVAANPLPEKLALFWHGHFATSVQKVGSAALMLRQNELFRSLGAGDFGALANAVSKDAAMLIWLDARSNKKARPNENFARELMELFTLGIGNYTETDVKEVARAFTGWAEEGAGGTAAYRFNARQHDDGSKTVLGHTGNLDGESVIALLAGSPASARWVVSRMWSRFARPVAPHDPQVDALLPAYGGRDCGALLRAVLSAPTFTSAEVQQGLVKQPVEWAVGALRALRLRATDKRLASSLTALGQLPFAPPSVGGWPANEAWLTTASSLTRVQLAQSMVAKADLSLVADAAPGDRPDAVAHLLSLDGWSARSAMALRSAADDPARLVTLALVSPEYVVN
ncbi:MAG: DUF1800 domain-containing protein [Actinomycetota bacterium]|nr:DUF1800 domain-containing protein [Actinomycetota bacterium]